MTKTCVVPLLTLLLLLIGGLTDSHGFARSRTPSGAAHFWPSTEVTLNLLVGCPPDSSLTAWGPCWDNAAEDAAAHWNAADARFAFFIRRNSVPAFTCGGDGFNTVGWAFTVCGMPFGPGILAVTTNQVNIFTGEVAESDVVFNSNLGWTTYTGPADPFVHDFHRVAIHEFGHVLGLAHPDDYGQRVRAIMNAQVSGIEQLQLDDLRGIHAIYGSRAAIPIPPTRGALENPGPGAFKSGIGIISGWVCEATQVEVEIDGRHRIAAEYGTDRADTRRECGDSQNGFVTLFNWNILGRGRHTMRLLADNVEIARSSFTVTTFGQEFLQGAAGAYTLRNFPWAGSSTVIEWEESSQNFVIRGVE